MDWFRYLNKLSRDRILFMVLIGLPVLMYILASIVSVYVDLDSKSESLIRSIAPVFDTYYTAIAEKTGVRAGQRFLIISFALSISFLLQNIFSVALAFVDHRNNRLTLTVFTPAVFFSCAVIIALFWSFFYFPNTYVNNNTRSARLLFSTDVKYFFMASIFGFSSIAFYVFLRLLTSFFRRH